MSISQKIPSLFLEKGGLNILVFLVVIGLVTISFIFELKLSAVEADFEVSKGAEAPQFSLIQNNTLSPISSPLVSDDGLAILDEIPVVITAYSSTVWETDDNPHLTAAGTWVREGIVANNMLPFGTKIRIPELYGEKVFVVEDRMSWMKGNYHVDIWFPSYWEALNFGAKRTYIEILES